MSYDAQEISVQDGAPIELYTFAQDTSEWFFTSSGQDYRDETEISSVNSDGNLYESASITRTPIAATEEEARNRLRLTVPRTFAVAELLRVAPPSDAITVIVRRVHRGDTANPVTVWVGRVLSCVFQGAAAELDCEPITVSLGRTGLRRLYGKSCPFALYGQGCGLDKPDFDHATTVSSVSGLVLTVASVDGAYTYAGGFVEWVNDDGNTERRFITAATGTALTLMMPFQGIAASDAVTIYPGCDHTLATCDTTFANAANYGGFAWFPSRNPFAGTPVV